MIEHVKLFDYAHDGACFLHTREGSTLWIAHRNFQFRLFTRLNLRIRPNDRVSLTYHAGAIQLIVGQQSADQCRTIALAEAELTPRLASWIDRANLYLGSSQPPVLP